MACMGLEGSSSKAVDLLTMTMTMMFISHLRPVTVE